MEVEYTVPDYRDRGDRQETQRIAEFLYDEILFQEKHDRFSKEKIRLEDQPKMVCEALGRLVECLLEKNVLTLENLKYITQCDWGKKADSLKLKKEE